MVLPTVLNIIGLVLDITGVVVLFYTHSKGLSRIQTPKLSTLSRVKAITNEAQDITYELVRNVNAAIEKSNQENQSIFKKSKRWLWIIVVGFSFQLASSLILLICNHS